MNNLNHLLDSFLSKFPPHEEEPIQCPLCGQRRKQYKWTICCAYCTPVSNNVIQGPWEFVGYMGGDTDDSKRAAQAEPGDKDES